MPPSTDECIRRSRANSTEATCYAFGCTQCKKGIEFLAVTVNYGSANLHESLKPKENIPERFGRMLELYPKCLHPPIDHWTQSPGVKVSPPLAARYMWWGLQAKVQPCPDARLKYRMEAAGESPVLSEIKEGVQYLIERGARRSPFFVFRP